MSVAAPVAHVPSPALAPGSYHVTGGGHTGLRIQLHHDPTRSCLLTHFVGDRYYFYGRTGRPVYLTLTPAEQQLRRRDA